MATHAQFYEIAIREMLASNPALSEDVARAPGSEYNTHANAIAATASEVMYQLSERDRAAYLDTAFGEALSRWVSDRYAFERQAATASVASVVITRLGNATGLVIPALTGMRTADGVKFRTDTAAYFVGGGSLTATVGVTSTAAGSSQNVAANSITQFDGGAPETGLTITQAERAAGGNESETDEQLKARARSFFLNAGKGILTAIVQGALTVPQVREAAAWEDLDPEGNPAGSVTLVIADASGTSNSTLATAVTAALTEWRGAGIPVWILGATVRLVSISVRATWQAGAGTPANNAVLRQAIVARVNTLDPNGAPSAALAPAQCLLTPGLIERAADTVPGLVRLEVLSPTGTEAPAKGEVIRTDAGRVTVT